MAVTSSKLGHFNLLEEIGRGGMGGVYRAFDPTLNREVAIKVLREELAKDPKFLQSFLQEARSAAAISHPHIVQIHFVGEESGQYYIVMELLKGRTLRDIVEKDGPLPEERALEIAIQVVEGLRAAYKNNQMIHGDIKPANIFITHDVGAKILDFGLAKLANVEVAHGEGIWGSPYYISPERVGQKAEDFRSDIYSLGATLFQMLTGRPPFDAESPEELAAKRLNEKPPLLRDINPNITRKTEEVVNKMLNKSIFLRYRDYDALLEDLRDAKTEATAKRLGIELHPEPKPPVPEALPVPKKSPLPLILAAAGAVIVIVGVLAWVFWPREPAPAQPKPGPVAPGPRQVNVEFTLRAPNARAVYLAGEFNNWSATATPMARRADGVWAVTVALPPGRHAYKFVVDGNWMADPDNPARVADNYGGYNSVVTVGETPPPAPVQPPPKPPAATPPAMTAPAPPVAPRTWNVEFTLRAPQASKVFLAGEFNRWSPTATPMRRDAAGVWRVTIPLEAGRYAYKFVVDGKWMPDPDNPERADDGYGGYNSVVVIGR